MPIYVATDIHYLAPELHDDGAAFEEMVRNADGKDTSHCDAIIDALGYELPKPSILIVTGDLTFNGAEASHRALASRFEALRKEGVQVFVLPGNHDLDNPWAREFRGSSQRRVPTVSASEFREIYAKFGFERAAASDAASLSYLAKIDDGLAVLMLDSTLHERNVEQGYPSSGGLLQDSTLRWIDKTLNKARRQGQKVIVAMHHNLVDHNSMLSDGYTLFNADELVLILQRHEIQYVLAGHIHIQSIAMSGAEREPIFDIATGALAVYPHNYGSLYLDPASEKTIYRTKRLDIAAWAQANQIKDPYLENFSESSRKYFGSFGRRLVDRFGLSEGLTPKETGQLLNFMADLNCEFFAGTIDASRRKLFLASPGYKAISKLAGSFLSDYVDSVLEPVTIGDNSLCIPSGAFNESPAQECRAKHIGLP